MDKAGARDSVDIVHQKLDAIQMDPKVGDEAHIFFEAIGALWSAGGAGRSNPVGVGVLPGFQLVNLLLHGFHSGIGRGEGDLLGLEGLVIGVEEKADALLGMFGSVKSHLGNLLCEKESHFWGKLRPMDFEGSLS